jgi:hypothetical protein
MKKKVSFRHLMKLMLLLSLIISCEKNDSPLNQNSNPLITDAGTPTGDVSNTSIGTNGGTLTSGDGKITLTIPEGALSSASEISIQPITDMAPLSLGHGYRLLPKGTTFAQAVTITLNYDGQLLLKSPEDFYRLSPRQYMASGKV